jgi:hypothetical protein
MFRVKRDRNHKAKAFTGKLMDKKNNARAV